MSDNFYKRLQSVINECEKHPYKATIPLDLGGVVVRVSKQHLGEWTDADYSIHLSQTDERTNEICDHSRLACFVYCDKVGYIIWCLVFCNMIDLEEEIEFTDVEAIFTKAEIKKMLKYAKVEPHQCHSNSFWIAVYLNCGVCEGAIRGYLPHAFNCIIRKDKRIYFDMTDYNNKRLRLIKDIEKEATVLRRYDNVRGLMAKFKKEQMFYLTIERDGLFLNYIENKNSVNGYSAK